MCIRDRHIAACGAEPGDELLAVELVGVEHAHHAAGVNVDAVSYTHLRAHETVLDLVCRLLLEKKNKGDRNHISFVERGTLTDSIYTNTLSRRQQR